jgi:hypothetical protein
MLEYSDFDAVIKKVKAREAEYESLLLEKDQQIAMLEDKLRAQQPVQTAPHEERLEKPYTGPDVVIENKAISLEGQYLIQPTARDGLRSVTIRNTTIYNGRGILEYAVGGPVHILLENVVLADLLQNAQGVRIRGVMTPELRSKGWKVVAPAVTRYGIYLETRDFSVTPPPISDDPSLASTITIRNCQLGSPLFEHVIRTYGAVDVTIEDSIIFSWLNPAKGDQINGGPALRLHGTGATIRNSRIGFASSIGSEGHSYSTKISLENVQFYGNVRWPNNRTTVKWEKVTRNGNAI